MYIYKNEHNHQQADDWLWDTIPNIYFITFTNDYSRYGFVYLMHQKSRAFAKFIEFKHEVEK